MTVAVPVRLDEVVRLLGESPDATLLAGGTDAMVEVNDGHRRPADLVIALNRVAELRSWTHDPDAGIVRLGAAVTYTEMMRPPLSTLLPALAEAARTVGSPQIRNAGTLGGNLGTCSPAGDGLPVLAALDAEVSLVSSTGERTLPVADFMVGPKRTALGPGEVIAHVDLPVAAGWQGYAKVGVRNAMVISIASACLVLDDAARSTAIALGSVGPTVLRCRDAESELAAAVAWDRPASSARVTADAVERFGAAVSADSRPISDHRSSADYRRHAVGVLARRLARRALAAEEVAA